MTKLIPDYMTKFSFSPDRQNIILSSYKYPALTQIYNHMETSSLTLHARDTEAIFTLGESRVERS